MILTSGYLILLLSFSTHPPLLFRRTIFLLLPRPRRSPSGPWQQVRTNQKIAQLGTHTLPVRVWSGEVAHPSPARHTCVPAATRRSTHTSLVARCPVHAARGSTRLHPVRCACGPALSWAAHAVRSSRQPAFPGPTKQPGLRRPMGG